MTKFLCLIAVAVTTSGVYGQCDTNCKCSTTAIVKFDPSKIVLTATPSVTVETSFGIRSPQGHTHTCANGHTWDHSVTAGHDCPVCGLSQFVQDSSPRTVNTVRVSAPVQQYVPQQQYRIAPQSGCANGQCPTAVRYVR